MHVSQLVSYDKTCSGYQYFLIRGHLFTSIIFSQRYMNPRSLYVIVILSTNLHSHYACPTARMLPARLPTRLPVCLPISISCNRICIALEQAYDSQQEAMV